MSDRTERYSNFYGTIGTKWPAPLLDARAAIVWCIGHSSRMQRHINVGCRIIRNRQPVEAAVPRALTRVSCCVR